MRHRLAFLAPSLLAALACGQSVDGITVLDIVNQISETQYRYYLDNRLYTHDGHNRGMTGPEHDPCRDNIVQDFVSFGLPTAFETYPDTAELKASVNVVATKLGKVRPQNIWIVSAHYDSRDNPGANDDATGVAAVLEIARVLAPHDFEDTIVFIAFDTEEVDRSGSRAYSMAHQNDRILGIINFDMIGYNPGNINQAHITNRVYSPLQDEMAAMVLVYGQGLIPIVSVRYVGVDSDSFVYWGFEAFNLVELYPANPHYHEPTDSVDTPNYIDYTFATRITRCAAAFVATKAVLMPPPPDVTPPAWVGDLKGQPANSAGAVDLTWSAAADESPAHPGLQACTQYELRYSSSPILHDDDGAAWNAATAVAGLPPPMVPGSAESFRVTGLAGNSVYYFALKAVDAAGNVSEVSNCAQAVAPVVGEAILRAGLEGYTGVRDTYIVAGYLDNHGSSGSMDIRGYLDQDPTNVSRCLLRFDLAGLPANASLTKAEVHLHSYDPAATSGTTGFYGLYPLTRTWTDSEANWAFAANAAPWATPGSDFLPRADATATKQGAADAWYRFDVTSRVQEWLGATGGNFGWVLMCTDETLANHDRFHTSEALDPAVRPYMRITDLKEAVTCDTNADGLVDVVDLLSLVFSFGTFSGVDRSYDPWADFNADGTVDSVDLLILVDNWPADDPVTSTDLLNVIKR